MREIEIKAQVNDTARLKEAILALGISLSEPLKQHDIVYARPGAISNQNEENWLRIRIENDTKTIFTLKRSVTSELDSIEHETVVEDAAELTAIIGYLGYELFSDLTKIRQKGHYGEIEICYDELPGLGNYVEAELMCPEDVDVDTILARLWDFFGRLGIERSDEETRGYDIIQLDSIGEQAKI